MLSLFKRTARSALLSLGDRLVPGDDRTGVRCLYGHYVFDQHRDQFRHHIEMLQSIGRFIDFEHLLDILSGSRPVDGRYFHLSFDDGFRNVVQNALPFLERRDIPATLFVPTDLAGASRQRAAEFARNEGYDEPVPFADWDQLRSAASRGFEIGAHTLSHARLSDLSGSDLRREIVESKQRIDEEIGRPCRVFSWPYGTDRDINNRALQIIKEAGFEACFSAIRGPVTPGSTDPFRIPREHFEADWPASHVRFFARGIADYLPL